ncbi:hypothetical protein CR513_12083, partial [Mucuna pruriens]
MDLNNDRISSTSEYVFTFGGIVISWKSTKQTCIVRSNIESKFIALKLTNQETKWSRGLMTNISLTHTCMRHSVVKDNLK